MTDTTQYSQDTPADGLPAPRRSHFQEFWRLLEKNRLAFIGLAIFVLFFITAIAGLALTSGTDPFFDPALVRLQEKLRPPLSSPKVDTLRPEEIPRLGLYLLGTDDLGRDVFARMLQGAWVSLTVGFVAVGISVIIGIFMGGISGYFGQNRVRVDQIIAAVVLIFGIVLLSVDAINTGTALLVTGIIYLLFSNRLKKVWVRRIKKRRIGFFLKGTISIDTLIMRFVDIMLCIYNIMIVIGLTSWMGATRFVRAEFLSLREQDFVTAAQALGISDRRIIFRHMIPNAIGPVLISATIGIASAILTEAGLSFLGFGVPPPHATWGNILSDGKRFIFDAPWLTFIPGFTILIVVLSFNLFGEGLRDILNPKLRERY